LKHFWKRSQLSTLLIAGLAACLFNPAAAPAAGITISLAPAVAAPGSTANFFDVDLTNLGAAAIKVGGFAFNLSIANANISFTDANVSTTALYVFSGNSLFGPDLTGPVSGQTISASDAVSVVLSGTTISSGSTVGLGRVLFNVSAGAAPGVFAVNLVAFPFTSLSDAAGNNISIDTLSAGQITITGVPEPSFMFLLPLLMAAVVLRRPRILFDAARLGPGRKSLTNAEKAILKAAYLIFASRPFAATKAGARIFHTHLKRCLCGAPSQIRSLHVFANWRSGPCPQNR
jgi:hypothetical protein